MKIDNKRIEELAHLARLEFDESQKKTIKADLEKIINFCDKLKEVDTDAVEPLIYVGRENNVLRQDIIQNPLDKDQALKNAPSRDSDYFKVPKVIKK